MFKKLLKHLKSKSDLIDEINELKGVLDEKCRALLKLRADSQHRESELLKMIEFKDSQIADFERVRQEKDEYIKRLKIKCGQMAHENRMRNKKKSKFNKKGI
ncbi:MULTISPECIES: hypothetical protein [Pasteurella]|uniref:Uncharacterized protein n=1 Tax=Pasteurella oralis TaxID=1071947 RepID=A0ABW4NU81_9PAST|nr:hypothetical protein [Pasteurella multocida]WNY73915.1 hypothetical protein H2512_10905 [Pasteurella multocida]HDX1111691.1 hypothetical protein [Pasteurella multocida]